MTQELNLDNSICSYVVERKEINLWANSWSKEEARKIIDVSCSPQSMGQRAKALRDYMGYLPNVDFNFQYGQDISFTPYSPLNYTELTHLFLLSYWISCMRACNGVSPRYKTYFDKLSDGDWESLESVMMINLQLIFGNKYPTLNDFWIAKLVNWSKSKKLSEKEIKLEMATIEV